MKLSLTSEQEVLEGHLLCILQGQLEPLHSEGILSTQR